MNRSPSVPPGEKAPTRPWRPYDTAGTYQLVVLAAGPQGTQSVASWQVLPGRDAQVAGSTDLSPEQIVEVQQRGGAGIVLLEGSPSR